MCINKCVYSGWAIDINGQKDILGIGSAKMKAFMRRSALILRNSQNSYSTRTGRKSVQT